MGKVMNFLRNLIQRPKFKVNETSSERTEKAVKALRKETGKHFVRRLV